MTQPRCYFLWVRQEDLFLVNLTVADNVKVVVVMLFFYG